MGHHVLDSTAADYNSFAAMLKIIGGIAMNLMVPVLSAYIAESIGKRPALVPGFVAGMIAIQGLPVNADTHMIDAGGTGVGFGFLGGIVGGFLAGYVILLLEKVFAGLPKNLDRPQGHLPVPACSRLAIVGLVMLGISGPMAAINTAMMDFLKGLSASGAVVLGLAIGCMCAFDMGGPVNKVLTSPVPPCSPRPWLLVSAPTPTTSAPTSWLPSLPPASFRR